MTNELAARLTNLLMTDVVEGDDPKAAMSHGLEILDVISELIHRNQIDIIGDILRDIDAEAMPTLSILSVARWCGPVRKVIPGWNEFITKAAHALRGRGDDAERMLQGILDKSQPGLALN